MLNNAEINLIENGLDMIECSEECPYFDKNKYENDDCDGCRNIVRKIDTITRTSEETKVTEALMHWYSEQHKDGIHEFVAIPEADRITIMTREEYEKQTS